MIIGKYNILKDSSTNNTVNRGDVALGHGGNLHGLYDVHFVGNGFGSQKVILRVPTMVFQGLLYHLFFVTIVLCYDLHIVFCHQPAKHLAVRCFQNIIF